MLQLDKLQGLLEQLVKLRKAVIWSGKKIEALFQEPPFLWGIG
jgi:hypothetical protein